jgi:hypothetical protein
MTTTWAWDTAANGIGKLHKLTSPDGEKVFAYNTRGQLAGLTLAVNGTDALLEGKLGYDEFGRVGTITYPTPAGAPPFVIKRDFDAFGHVLKVHDGVTDYWRLTDVDNAGRFRKEALGDDVLTERSYFDDKQRLKSIVSQGPTTVQNLAYEYDARLSLKSRTDALQPQHKTERFRYDALDRLTCAYFSANEDPFAPCATDPMPLRIPEPAGRPASLATGGASLLVTAAGGSAATAGWAAVGHGATGIVAGLATLADSLSLSTGAASGSGGTGPQGTTPAPGGRQNVTDILRPGGKLIGNPGTSPKIRLLQGGRPEAEALFARLTQGGEAITSTNYPGQLVRLPDGGRIGFRPTSTMWATDNRRIY